MQTIKFDDIAALTAKIGKEGNRFSALVTAIVTSDPFLKRRPEVVAKN